MCSSIQYENLAAFTCTHTHTPGPPRQTSFFKHQSLSNEKTSSSGARNEMAQYAQKHVNCTMRVLNYKIPFFIYFFFILVMSHLHCACEFHLHSSDFGSSLKKKKGSEDLPTM